MKRHFSRGLHLLCGCLVILSLGCKKSQDVVNAPNQTILQHIAKDPQLTILQAAITRCAFDTLFTSGGPFTFFCPVDSAFAAAGLTLDKIDAYPPDSLTFLLKYSLLYGRFSSADAIGFLTEQVTSLDSGYSSTVVKNYYGLFINGITVAPGEEELGDGVLQKIGQVNFPPVQTVLQLIDSLPELGLYAAVVSQVPQLQSLYGSYAPPNPNQNASLPGFTVLIPTNDAFAGTIYSTVAAIDQESPYALQNLFGSLVINGYWFTPQFLGGFEFNANTGPYGELYTYGGEVPFEIDKDGRTILVYNPNYNSWGTPGQVPPRISRPNILGSNGVIHEINQVIF